MEEIRRACTSPVQTSKLSCYFFWTSLWVTNLISGKKNIYQITPESLMYSIVRLCIILDYCRVTVKKKFSYNGQVRTSVQPQPFMSAECENLLSTIYYCLVCLSKGLSYEQVSENFVILFSLLLLLVPVYVRCQQSFCRFTSRDLDSLTILSDYRVLSNLNTVYSWF